jgi:hypothetical protein
MAAMMLYLLILLPETTISVPFRLFVIEISAFIVWIFCIDVAKVEWGTCFISYRYVNIRLRGVVFLVYFIAI